jgi:hypothetical protein
VKRFIYLFCLIAFFNFVSVLQQIIYFNSIIKYIVPVLFLITSLSIYLKSKPNWLLTNSDKVFYYLFACFTFYLLIDSIRFEVFYIQEFLVSQYYILPYVLPLFMLNITLDSTELRLYLSIAKKLLLPGLLILLVILANLNLENWYFHVYLYELFLFGFPLLFLTTGFFPKNKTKILLFSIYILMLFIAAFYGRRSLFVDIIFLFAFLQLIQISSKTISNASLFLRYFLLLIMMAPVIQSNSENITQLYVFQRGFNQEAWDESRGRVMEDYFEDFSSVSDWVFGRGLNGTIKRTIKDDTDVGSGIENGYLHLILKAGNIYFFFVLYFFLKAFYLGWFKSNNDFTKAFAALLLIHLLGMIGFNLPVFSHRYMLLWLSIPICFSVYYRSLTNKQVQQLIIPK